MNRHKPLQRTRIGAVSFLNTAPLVYGLEDRVQFFPPAQLSDEFDAGRIDVGLLPIVEYFQKEDRLLIPRIALGTAGAVGSVKLFLAKPLRELRVVALDSRSRTSILLLRVLLELRHKIRPQYVFLDLEKKPPITGYDGILMIGDDALRFDGMPDAMDLGEEWVRWTGLPFVFASWQVRQGFSDDDAIAMLEQAAALGISKIPQIAALTPGFEQTFVEHYLSQRMCYEFGEDQQHAIELFARFLTQIKSIAREKAIAYYDRQDLGKGLFRVAT